MLTYETKLQTYNLIQIPFKYYPLELQLLYTIYGFLVFLDNNNKTHNNKQKQHNMTQTIYGKLFTIYGKKILTSLDISARHTIQTNLGSALYVHKETELKLV